MPVSTAIPAEGSRPHAMIRAPTRRRAVPSRGQARSVREPIGGCGHPSGRAFATLSSAHERTSVAKLEREGEPSAAGRADGVADGVRVRSFHPIRGGMRTALLVMVLEQVARERVSAFTPPRSASRADLSAPCRPVGAPPCLQARRTGARGRGRPVARGLHEVPTTNADLVDVRFRSLSGRTPRYAPSGNGGRARLTGSIAARLH